jgi:S-adenosylmethionine decarboxylase
MAHQVPKLNLEGFNNLTKSLSFNLYDICYAKDAKTRREYIEYIDAAYSAERLTEILREVTSIIGATVLNIARQDYQPDGASVAMLIADGPLNPQSPSPEVAIPHGALVGHLDASHICVHTYPESHPDWGISTFRVDLDVSTCGEISPLRALDYLLGSFEDDVVTLDYRVRGFTRDTDGRKHYIDHEIRSIQDFVDTDILERYEAVDINILERNLFHTRLMVRDFDLDDHLFGEGVDEMDPDEQILVSRRVQQEMLEIFHGRNLG